MCFDVATGSTQTMPSHPIMPRVWLGENTVFKQIFFTNILKVFQGQEYVSPATLSENVPILACGGIGKKYVVPGWRLGWILIHDRNGVFKKEVASELRGVPSAKLLYQPPPPFSLSLSLHPLPPSGDSRVRSPCDEASWSLYFQSGSHSSHL